MSDYGWDKTLATVQEKREHLDSLTKNILRYRYAYYVLDDPLISDWEYDHLERYYEKLAHELGAVPAATNMVGWKEPVGGYTYE